LPKFNVCQKEPGMLPLRLAVRFLKTGRGQTILIIIGIAIAVAAQIFIGLLINSLQKTLIDRTLGNSPQITITSATDNVLIKDWSGIVNTIIRSGLTKTVGISASGNAFIQKGTKNQPILIRGLDAASENIYGISNSIYAGSWSPNQPGVLIGKDLQQDYNYALGNYIVVKTPGGAEASYRINGFYDLGVANINKTWVITSLGTAQSFFGYNLYVTSIEITINDLFQADVIAGRLAAEINNKNLTITNWKSQNQQLLSGLQGQSTSSLMIQIFIIVSVVIAIAAILAITVFQKSRQLGILKAMGIKDRSASLIFIYEGLIIGFISATIGVALGLGLLYGFAIGTAQPGTPAIIDLYLDYQFVAISWAIAIASAVLAALIPARRSLRLNPIDVIREG
jgi:lipoprotein-releasing system permease protein